MTHEARESRKPITAMAKVMFCRVNQSSIKISPFPLIISERERADKKGSEKMSEKEKAMAEGIAKLPAELQDKFLDQITGAAVAVECMAAQAAEKQDQK